MTIRTTGIGVLMVAFLLVSGCLRAARVDLAERTGGAAALLAQFQAYDGRSGRPISFGQVLDRCRRADVILFGEEHSDAVCNQLEAQLLYGLGRQSRPVALAMEFFEADTQVALDAYLLGRIDEPSFREQTRQGRAYALSHRPLIELCRAGHIPVLAANAPRRLVRAYRESGLSYEEYRAGLDPTEQCWLPATNEYVSGPYEARFFDLMAGHGPPTPPPNTQPATQPATTMPATQPSETQPTTAPASTPAGQRPSLPTMPASAPASQPLVPPISSTKSFYWSQLLWDQAMAESLAHFRDRYPSHRVMLIVGSFHVAHTGGTTTKFLGQRPHDRVVTIVYRGTPEGRFEFQDEDRHAGDIVIYGIIPPSKKEEEQQPVMPATMPSTTQPTATAPATQPTLTEEPTPAEAGGAAAFPCRELPIREAVVIGGVGRYGRSPVHTDAVEYQIVTGTWEGPQAQDTLELPDGTIRTWESASAGEDGWIRSEALRGGYACATIDSDREQIVLLDASGHSMVYVNGEPRAGDPYQNGIVLLPILLKPGRNELLFACGRGQLRAKLAEPEAPVTFNLRDTTLPDLIVGQPADAEAAVVVVNASRSPIRDGRVIATYGGTRETTAVGPIPALGVRKIGYRIVGPPPQEAGEEQVELELVEPSPDVIEHARTTITLRVRQPHESYRRTFRSHIDGSMQYYAVQPMSPAAEPGQAPALFLTLHGAGVEALGQVNAYSPKDWGYIVAPTNRRQFGFDWEDWGRIDAMEVLEHAQQSLGTDPRRTYLTGHSMGGHGVWQIGAHYPDRFAAIAPSAGWISFWSYAGAERFGDATPIEAILRRAGNPSDTLALSRNYLHYGVYILHGENDDNVPVEQARQMREHLSPFHPDVTYHEQPGAGHWWDGSAAPGTDCVDWPPLFEFFRNHVGPPSHTVRDIEFVTANPAISASCHWVTIDQQVHALEFSRVDLHLDPDARRIHGRTENVARLVIHLRPGLPEINDARSYVLEPNRVLSVELDGQSLDDIPWSKTESGLWLARRDGRWQIIDPPAETVGGRFEKRPFRGGPFKEAFRNYVQFVYGTGGTAEENTWALAKARFDAETFWYRGNGSIAVVPDREFQLDARGGGMSVILYGNAQTNSAWDRLLPDIPINVRRGRVQVGDHELVGDDFTVLAIYPYSGGWGSSLVGIVAGTGLPGMRLTERLPYFVSGVGYPDWIVLGTEMLEQGVGGVRAAGFFSNDWQIDPEQSAWREP